MTWLERHAAELEEWAARMNREIKAMAESRRRSIGQLTRYATERIKRGNP